MSRNFKKKIEQPIETRGAIPSPLPDPKNQQGYIPIPLPNLTEQRGGLPIALPLAQRRQFGKLVADILRFTSQVELDDKAIDILSENAKVILPSKEELMNAKRRNMSMYAVLKIVAKSVPLP